MTPAPKGQRRFRSVSLFWLLPNMLTVAGLISGLTALRFALDGRWAATIGLMLPAEVSAKKLYLELRDAATDLVLHKSSDLAVDLIG